MVWGIKLAWGCAFNVGCTTCHTACMLPEVGMLAFCKTSCV
jgi:hypothetical protein